MNPTNWNVSNNCFGSIECASANDAQNAKFLFDKMLGENNELRSLLLQLTGQTDLEIISWQRARIDQLERVLAVVARELPRMGFKYLCDDGTPLLDLVKAVLEDSDEFPTDVPPLNRNY